MKVTVDEKACNKHKLTLREALVALAIKMHGKDLYTVTLSNLQDKEVIYFDSETADYYVTPHWNDTIDEIIADSSEEISDERLSKLAPKVRECFPQGKMPGTPYYYRCNNREVMLRLKKFFSQYGNYSDEEIIEATKKYVASFKGNYRYMPLIKYFIMKNKTIKDEDGGAHIEEVSPLADCLENKEVVSYDNDDWLSNTRN